jgi:hypothetical protein
LIVLALAMFYLAYAVSVAGHRVMPGDFVVNYSSGMILGAGIAIVVASYKVTREIAAK